jgi:hypothetical protein
LYISIEKGEKIMKTYIYLILTKGSDGKFTTSAYQTVEDAEKALEMYIEAQKEIEALGGDIHIDLHKYERLRLPEFVMRDDDILAQVTVYTKPVIAGKPRDCVTDRYIIRVPIS